MKKNSKKKIQLMDLAQLKQRFNSLKNKRKSHESDSRMMKYLRYHMRTRFNSVV